VSACHELAVSFLKTSVIPRGLGRFFEILLSNNHGPALKTKVEDRKLHQELMTYDLQDRNRDRNHNRARQPRFRPKILDAT
jgi:hypothetical protein